MDFNPRSIIDRTRNTPYLQNNKLMEDYHVKTNNMDDYIRCQTLKTLRKYRKTNTEDLQEEGVQLNDKQARASAHENTVVMEFIYKKGLSQFDQLFETAVSMFENSYV
ncbi:hypothetical protein QTP88_019826 [Uroleucon formosanum]